MSVTAGLQIAPSVLVGRQPCSSTLDDASIWNESTSHLEFVSTGLLWVAVGSPKSAVGSDGTLWTTYGYPQKSSAHRSVTLKINISSLHTYLLVLLSKSECAGLNVLFPSVIFVADKCFCSL